MKTEDDIKTDLEALRKVVSQYESAINTIDDIVLCAIYIQKSTAAKLMIGTLEWVLGLQTGLSKQYAKCLWDLKSS